MSCKHFNSLFVVVFLLAWQIGHAQTYKFDFGDGPVAPGYIGITSKSKFSTTIGYGIDRGTVTSVDRGGSDALTQDYLTTSDEMFFSVAVPQGNYTVTLILGDPGATSATTVKAENSRLLLDRIATTQGSTIRQTISIRRMAARSIDGSVTMSINTRENDYYTWDSVLTIRISGKKPAVAGIEIKKNNDAVTVFLCGNSTVVDQLTAPWTSWGQMVTNFFDSSVTIANYAESGLTSGSFMSMKRLSKLLTEVKAGDYVFVEFGHNDQKSTSGVAAYPNNLKMFSDQIKAKGAIPVFVIPTARQGDTDPKTSIGGLAQTMRETALNIGVVFIDLNQMVIDLQKALGANAKYLYMYSAGDGTHFCEYGGYELARSVMKGIEEKIPSLKSRFRQPYISFNPSTPDPLNILEQAISPISSSSSTTSSSSISMSSSSSASIVALCGNSTCDALVQGENFCIADGIKESTNPGFSGDGYLNLTNAFQSKVTYRLNANKIVDQTIFVRYANGGSSSRTMSIEGAQSNISGIDFKSTGGWANWETLSIPLKLSIGPVALQMISQTGDGGPNIDWIGWTGTDLQNEPNCSEPTSTTLNMGNKKNVSGHFEHNVLILDGLPDDEFRIKLSNAAGKILLSGIANGPVVSSSRYLPSGNYNVVIVTAKNSVYHFQVKK